MAVGISPMADAMNVPLTAPTLVPEIRSTLGALPRASANSLKMYSRTPTSYAPRAPPPESIKPRPLNVSSSSPKPTSGAGLSQKSSLWSSRRISGGSHTSP